MPQTHDLNVIALLEQAQSLPDSERDAWLTGQPVPESVRADVRRLLAAESRMAGFLDDADIAIDDLPDFDTPSVGDRLGNYELLRPLAAGGMGVVYLGRRADDAYQQEVAIKLIRAIHLQGDSRSRNALIARFEDERAILARLNHPNIARILDGGRTPNGLPWLAMEHVDGVPITQHCRERRLGVEARLQLLCKVCDGVQEAHGHLIVHRDIKPDNVLVGDSGEPRLIDFGIARMLDETHVPSRSHATLLSAMTPAYASPEQVRHQPLTTGSDVYSLGVLLYQLIAERRPYELAGLSPAEVERVVCETQPPPLRQALRDTPMAADEKRQRIARIGVDLERIAAKALHKDPQRRYGSAQALAEDLRRYLAGLPVQAHPDSALYRSRKFIRRHTLGVGIAALAVLAVLTAAGVAMHQAAVAKQAASDMEETNRFLVEVLYLSDPYQSGSEISLGDAVDQVAEQVDVRFGQRPELAATLHLILGDSMRQRGRYEAANLQIGKALALNNAQFGALDPRSIEVLLSLAKLRSNEALYDEANALFNTVLNRISALRPALPALHYAALSDAGNSRLGEQDFETANRYLKQALALTEAHPELIDQADRGVLRSNLAHAARGLGDLDGADAQYEEAQAIFEAKFPDGSPQFATLLNNRGRVALDRGDIKKAAELGSRSLAMNRVAYGEDNPAILMPMTNLAYLYNEMAQPASALPLAEEAFQLADKTLDEAHPNRLRALVTLADALRQSGQIAAADARLLDAEAVIAAKPEAAAAVDRYLKRIRDLLCAPPQAAPSCTTRPPVTSAH